MCTENATYDVAVLGAGASGLVCAHRAALGGCRVLVVDHAGKPGRKMAVSGGGKCNFTNRHVSPADYCGENPDFCRSALARFTPEHAADLVRQAGIPIEEREHGQLFCARPAGELVRFLAERCRSAACRFVFDERILALRPSYGGAARFFVRTAKQEYAVRNVVVALGGPAWPQAGATGTGHELARAFGHRIIPVRPALVGLVMEENWLLTGLEGIAVPASIAVGDERPAAGLETGKAGRGKEKGLERGCTVQAAESLSLLFTHRGVSGPAVLQASLYWQKGRVLRVDFLPAFRIDTLLNELGMGKLLTRNLLKRYLPDRLAERLCPGGAADLKCASLTKGQREMLRENLHAFRMVPAGTEGFARAEVTAGGVSTGEVSSRNMESRRVPGLFFCGEVLDVTGRLGGYNLHWAFASGSAAGESLAAAAGTESSC